MTDQEIIKALCHCRRANWCDDECPYYMAFRKGRDWQTCTNKLMEDAAAHLQRLIHDVNNANDAIIIYETKCSKMKSDLTKMMAVNVQTLNKQVQELEKQLRDQKWHPGSEYPTEEKPYLVLILPCDMYGVPVSEKTCYEVVRWSSRFGWAMRRNGNVLYWQELPDEPTEEDD